MDTIKIDMKEWFDYVILRRGEEYFFDGRVINVQRTGLRYNAKVYGSRIYNVDIIIQTVIFVKKGVSGEKI